MSWSRVRTMVAAVGTGIPRLGVCRFCRGGEEDEVETAWWFRGGCGRGRGEVVGVLRWSWLLLGRDGNAEQQQQQQTDTALSRWQLLRNPCCLACPELCEAEKRPNPNRLALRAPDLCRRQPNSQARAMPWWEEAEGGQNSSARQKIACPAVQVHPHRHLEGSLLPANQKDFQHHPPRRNPRHHDGATSQLLPPLPTATIPAVFDTQIHIFPTWRPHFKEEGQEMLPSE